MMIDLRSPPTGPLGLSSGKRIIKKLICLSLGEFGAAIARIWAGGIKL